jgi:hypothetical protein
MTDRDLAEWDAEIEANFQRAVAATKTNGRRKRTTEPFVKVPLWWIEGAAKATKSPTILVLIEILRLRWLTQRSTVTLSNARLRKLGVNRKVKYHVLRDLVRAHFVSVEWGTGKAPRVTLLAL